MIELDGRDFLGRPLKIRPGVVKSSNERPQQQLDDSPRNEKKSMASFNRWQRNDIPTPSKNDSDQSRRVYVGGLPRLGDQETINIKITSFFGGLHVYFFHFLFPSFRVNISLTPVVFIVRALASYSLLTLPSDSNLVIITTSLLTSAAPKRLRPP